MVGDAGHGRESRLRRYALALAIHLAVAPFLIHDWDGFVFTRTAQDAMAGTSPYETAEAAPAHVFLDDAVNSWYAYPPLPLALFTPPFAAVSAVTDDPAALRLAIKIPFILGNLLLAWVAGALVLDATASGRARLWTERAILFNPFLVFIAAAWGMFDALMMAMLLLAVLLVSRGRAALGGAAFAAAGLMKLFPLFVSPLLAWWVWTRRSAREAVRFVAASVLVYAAVSLPFFLEAPRGFLGQWLLMHGARAPQGFALVSAPLHLRQLNEAFGWSLPVAPVAVVAAVSTALLALVLVLAHALAPRARDVRGLIAAILVAFLGTLLVNKVVNEQYLVMPVALLTVLAGMGAARERRALAAFTWGGLVSSVLVGFHFITFVPADVAAWTVRMRPDDVVHAIATAIDVPVFAVFAVPHALALLALVPALVATLTIVLPAWRGALADARAALARAIPRRIPRPTRGRFAAVALALALAVPPVATAVLAVPPAPAEPLARSATGVLAFRYDLAIRNPSYSPEVRDGHWLADGMPRPADGYYATNPARVAADFARLVEIGAQVVLVAYDAGNRIRLTTALDAGRDAGLLAAPVLEAASLAHCPDAQFRRPTDVPALGALRDADAALLERCARGALLEFRAHAWAWRLDDRPVLVVRDADAVATPALVAALRAGAGDAFIVAAHDARAPPPDWADAAYADAPLDGEAREAMAAWERATSAPSGGLVVRTAFPATRAVPWQIDGSSTLERTWRASRHADVLVVPWNMYREGAHVEGASDGSAELECQTLMNDAPIGRAEWAAASIG